MTLKSKEGDRTGLMVRPVACCIAFLMLVLLADTGQAEICSDFPDRCKDLGVVEDTTTVQGETEACMVDGVELKSNHSPDVDENWVYLQFELHTSGRVRLHQEGVSGVEVFHGKYPGEWLIESISAAEGMVDAGYYTMRLPTCDREKLKESHEYLVTIEVEEAEVIQAQETGDSEPAAEEWVIGDRYWWFGFLIGFIVGLHALVYYVISDIFSGG